MHEVRPLDRDESAEIVAVADGMRATLVEVLGLARGVALYDHDWLVARVRWHLDPERCDGEVFARFDLCRRRAAAAAKGKRMAAVL